MPPAQAVEELRLSFAGLITTDDDVDGAAATSTATATAALLPSAVDWPRATAGAKEIADSLASERARSLFGATPLAFHVAHLLQQSLASGIAVSALSSEEALWKAQTQLARVVGNFVLDHPENRQRCLECAVPQALLAALQALSASAKAVSPANIAATKACIGALLNLTIDTPRVRDLLVAAHAPDVLAPVIVAYRPASWTTAIGASLGEMRLLSATAEWAMNLLVELVKEDQPLSAHLARALAATITSFPLARSNTRASNPFPDDMHKLVDTDLVVLSSASELLETRIYDNESLQAALTSEADGNLLFALLDFVEHASIPPTYANVFELDAQQNGNSLEGEQTFAHIKASVARIVVGVSGNDVIAAAAFSQDPQSRSPLLSRATDMLRLSERIDLVTTGATILANLARTDAYSQAILQDSDIAEQLAKILSDSQKSSTSYKPSEIVQLRYAVAGLIKNLSIASANKQVLCDAGVISQLGDYLSDAYDTIQPLQITSVGALKHLCAGNVSSALQVVVPQTRSPLGTAENTAGRLSPFTPTTLSPLSTFSRTSGTQVLSPTTGPSPLSNALNLIERSDEPRLKFEATRAVVNVVRSLYSARSSTSPVTPAAMNGFETAMLKGKAREILESDTRVVSVLSEMARTGQKYPVLVNEAIVALTLLSTTENGATGVLNAMAKSMQLRPAEPLNPQSHDDKAEEDQPEQNLLSPISAPNPGQTTLPYRKGASLGSSQAPSQALDVAMGWLNQYAIVHVNMPPEMAGNVLALLDGLLSRASGAMQQLSRSDLPKVLDGVIARKAASPVEQALQELARGVQIRLDAAAPTPTS